MDHKEDNNDRYAESSWAHGDEGPESPSVPNTTPQTDSDQVVFEHFSAEDRAELTRIASNFPRHNATDSGISGMSTVERNDTLEGIELGDAVLDPTSDKFEHYKWARMMLRVSDRQGVTMRKSMGVVFERLSVSGQGSALQYQDNVGSLLLAPFRPREHLSCGRRVPQKQILHDFDGVLKSGELLIVLGRPGSGCSTFLKSISGELHGLKLGTNSDIQYNGIPMEKMHKEFKGEVLYNQEIDKHFPHLTVGQTLEFAAAARTPELRLSGISRARFAKYITQVAMAVLGLAHTCNTKGALEPESTKIVKNVTKCSG